MRAYHAEGVHQVPMWFLMMPTSKSSHLSPSPMRWLLRQVHGFHLTSTRSSCHSGTLIRSAESRFQGPAGPCAGIPLLLGMLTGAAVDLRP